MKQLQPPSTIDSKIWQAEIIQCQSKIVKIDLNQWLIKDFASTIEEYNSIIILQNDCTKPYEHEYIKTPKTSLKGKRSRNCNNVQQNE